MIECNEMNDGWLIVLYVFQMGLHSCHPSLQIHLGVLPVYSPLGLGFHKFCKLKAGLQKN